MSNKPSRTTFRNRLEEMVKSLKDDIIANKYPPGTYLPSENALVEQYSLSSKSVAKGLDMLQEEGLIIKIHRVGSMVKEVDSQKKVTITLGYSPDHNIVLEELIAEFSSLYSHIEVNTTSFEPYDHASIKKHIKSNKIDTFMLNYLDFQKIVETEELDFLEPLPVRQDISPFLYEPFIEGDTCYAQPLTFSPIILCYNKDHFTEAGLPEPDSDWTWKDLMHYASLLSKDNERYGLYFHALSENRWPIFQIQSGIKFEREPSGTYKIYGTKIMESFAFYRDLILNSSLIPPFFSENNSDANMLFLQGKISMTITSYFGLDLFRDSSLNYDIAPLPFFSEPLTLLLCIGMALNKNSENKEAANLLVQFLTSEKAQTIIRNKTLNIPSLKKIAQQKSGDHLNRPSRFNLYREIIPTFRYHKDLNLNVQSIVTIRQQLKFLLSKMESEDEMCVKLEHLL
ncbi:extracellular solute-binding protein [Paenibacillus eucommiae]|uniref:Multiple sugar transport system substrate-binding protein n=1 Tax=Paenibacillus eucommiae TaxID=1355755 RepID=A0ABS4ISP1_9BACL|nr:extracellular solute-binding protein [Paenibacillus eucommiae]MBP1990538.1 multiple sugar transport system substrate-binding protein [Paenibacillus eucommiae]